MLLTILFLFTFAVVIGLFMVVLGLRYRRSSLPLALSHAALALIALGLLFNQIFTQAINKFNNAAALLMVLALIGGLMLFALREKNKPPAMILVTIHAAMGLGGLLVLFLGFQDV